MDRVVPVHTLESGMFVQEYLAENSAGTLLFLPGLGSWGGSFDTIISHQLLSGWHKLVPDLPGYGRSPWTAEPLTLSEIADKIAGWLSRRAEKEVIVVGHSLGGVLATMLAEQCQQIVTGLINVEGNVLLEDCSLSALVAAQSLDDFVSHGFARLAEDIYHSGLSDQASRKYYASLCLCDPRAYHAHSLELVALSRSEKLAARLAALSIPVFFLAGSPGGISIHSLEALKKAGICCRIIEQAGHVPFVDQPECFVREVDAILAASLQAQSLRDKTKSATAVSTPMTGQALDSASAFGGPGWTPRTETHRQEIGRLWRQCGVENEWAELQQVILHRPGKELSDIKDPNAVQMLQPVDPERAGKQHDNLSEVFREQGINVHFVEPDCLPPPNLMFVADLLFMTAEGAILSRPASSVRAGEERWMAERLAGLGIPIIRCLRGQALFEGADAAWLDSTSVLIGTGFRTSVEGARQTAAALSEMGVRTTLVELPYGAMHLMGMLRFLDRDLAIVRSSLAPLSLIKILEKHGFGVVSLPDCAEIVDGMALNFVTLGPRKILMPAGNPDTQAFLESAGISCHTVMIDELTRAAGGIGCLTGIIQRDCL